MGNEKEFRLKKEGGGLVNRLLHGGPKYQERKRQRELDRETAGTKEWRKDQLRQAEDEARFKGELAGRREKGFSEGKARGKHGGGILGSIGAGLEAFDSAAGGMTAGMDFGNMGKGFNMDGAFGLGGGDKKRRTRPRHRQHRRSRGR